MSFSNKQSKSGIFENSQKPIAKLPIIPIAIACVFLFNAYINIIDILPDFIGYIIIGVAISKLAALNTDVEAASKCFRYMLCVDLSKYAALMWIFGITFGEEQSNAILLASFVYAVIEVILLTICFNKLFSGLIALGYVHENTAVIGSKKKGKRSYTEKIKSFTVFFIVVRSLFSVLPELSVLTTSEYTEDSFVMYLYEYIGTMRGIAFFLVTIIGIIWLVKIFRFFFRVRSDKIFCDALVERYNTDVVPKEIVFIRRQMAMATVMIVFAALFMVDVRFSGVSILPDALAAVFFAVGIFAMRKLIDFNHVVAFCVTAVFGVVNVIRHIVEYRFFDEYYYGAVYRSPEAYSAYCVMCAVSIVTVVAQALLVASIVLCLYKVIDRYTGFTVGENETRNRERLDALHKELKKRTLILAVAGLLSAATEIFFIFGAIKFGFADEIALIGNALLIVAIIKAFSDVREEIEAKYMLE